MQKTIDYDPDSVTVYQMELPFNTVYTKMLSEKKEEIHVADWQTKREWHQYAFEELKKVGFELSSAYTMVKKDKQCRFVYRDSVWQGTDMLGTGVASFGHMSGMHIQNTASWNDYIMPLTQGKLPLKRGFLLSDKERLTREIILQLKKGLLRNSYFKDKFGTDIIIQFKSSLQKLTDEGMLTFDETRVELTQKGLLRVDQLLPEFYAQKYRNARYT